MSLKRRFIKILDKLVSKPTSVIDIQFDRKELCTIREWNTSVFHFLIELAPLIMLVDSYMKTTKTPAINVNKEQEIKTVV